MTVARLQRALASEAEAAARELAPLLAALARAHAAGAGRDEPLAELARLLARVLAAADLGGRLELRFGSPAATPARFAAERFPGGFEVEATGPGDVVPSVAFDAALRDLETRDAVGAAELRRMGLEVEDAYGPLALGDGTVVYPHGFALARAADAEVAERVRRLLVENFARPTPFVVETLLEEWDWPRAYAETVVRTNYATATSAGRFREAERVERAGIHVGFRFAAVMDSDTRKGHAALHGVVARSDDPFWRSWTPPLGHNCRCVLEPVIGDEVPVEYVKGAPAGASKEPGFGSRPDLQTYGA